MKHHTRLAATTAAVLLASVSLAAAAGTSSSMGSSTTGSASSMSQPSDNLSLTSKDQKTAWQDISKIGTKQKVPSGFTASVGAAVPSGLNTAPVPVSTASKVPQLRQYQYALLDNNKLLIVNPSDKKVAEVITQ